MEILLVSTSNSIAVARNPIKEILLMNLPDHRYSIYAVKQSAQNWRETTYALRKVRGIWKMFWSITIPDTRFFRGAGGTTPPKNSHSNGQGR
nr:hypothetical protein [Tanacetum cinerariifolium]